MPKADCIRIEAIYEKGTKKMYKYVIAETRGSREAVGSIYVSKDNFENGENPPDKIAVEISM